MKRRIFLQTSGSGLAGLALSRFAFGKSSNFVLGDKAGGPLVVASGNGSRATAKAMEMIKNGQDALDAVIAGVNIVEEDPADMSVGYGGLPNEEGVVELDSCVMHGPTHNAGGVAALQNIKTPSKVARLVMERTDHVLLVGKGALSFAKAHGFKEENLLTDKARAAWLKWKEMRDPDDDWFPPDEKPGTHSKLDIPYTHGTITCMGLDMNSNISGVTTTSGLSYKIPGRVGDSAIIGAGLYVDNEVGACGSTGRGEENLKNLTCFFVVEQMRMGKKPQEACKEGIQRVISHLKIKNLLNSKGLPNFNISYYALNKKGEYGSASIYGPADFAVHDGKENKTSPSHYLYEWKMMSDK